MRFNCNVRELFPFPQGRFKKSLLITFFLFVFQMGVHEDEEVAPDEAVYCSRKSANYDPKAAPPLDT